MKYRVTNQYIQTIEADHLVAGSQEIYTAEFVFSTEWDGYDKRAIFLNESVQSEPYKVLLESDTCTIPWEAISKPGYLIVGVVGEKGTEVRPTIYAAPYFIDKSCGGPEHTEPTPSIWEQMLHRTAPAGGEEGQVLTKVSDDDYDMTWQDPEGGGTRDYADLRNKPEIEGITLVGNKTASDLGLAKISDIPDVSDFITKAVDDLVNYYTKAQTDSAIATAIGSITEIEFVVVQTLPATGENGKIYLVPNEDPQTQNIKAEYIYVSGAWEKIGDTSIDLSDYYTKSETDTLLSAKADNADLTNHTGDTDIHITASERTAWNGKASQSDLTAHTGDTTKHITANERTAWNAKADASDLTIHTGDTVVHITAQERTAWNGKADSADLTAHTGDTVKHITAQERTTWNGKADASDLTAHTGDTVKHITANERTAWNNKLDASALSGYATQLWVQQQGYLTQHQDITGKEDKTNKVTSLSSSSTDTQYPSAKCVYDIIGDVETLLAAL